jgi:hypothetical protein
MKLETETVFHTPSGDVVVPGEPMEFPVDMIATRDSNLAPLWLVFPNYIFNTHQINFMTRDDINKSVVIGTTDGSVSRIKVKDLGETWNALQKVFTEGLKE